MQRSEEHKAVVKLALAMMMLTDLVMKAASRQLTDEELSHFSTILEDCGAWVEKQKQQARPSDAPLH